MLLPRALLFSAPTVKLPPRTRRDLSLDLSLESEARTTLILVGIALAAVFLCSALFFCRHFFLALFRRVFRLGPIVNTATAASQALTEQAAPKKSRSPPLQEKPASTTAYTVPPSNNSVMPSTAYFPGHTPTPTSAPSGPPQRPGRTFFTKGPAPIRSASIPRRPAAVYAGTVNGLHHTHPAPLALRPGYPRQAPPTRPPRPFPHQSPFGRHHHAHNPYTHPHPQGYSNYSDVHPRGQGYAHPEPHIDPKIAALMHAADSVVGAHPNARPLSARIATKEEIELISGHVHIPWAFTGSGGVGAGTGTGTGIGIGAGGKTKRRSQPTAVKVQPPATAVVGEPAPLPSTGAGQKPGHGLQVPGYHQHIPAPPGVTAPDAEPANANTDATARAGPALGPSVLKDLRNTQRRDASGEAFEFGEGIPRVGLGPGRIGKQHRMRGKENVPPVFGGKGGRRNRF